MVWDIDLDLWSSCLLITYPGYDLPAACFVHLDIQAGYNYSAVYCLRTQACASRVVSDRAVCMPIASRPLCCEVVATNSLGSIRRADFDAWRIVLPRGQQVVWP